MQHQTGLNQALTHSPTPRDMINLKERGLDKRWREFTDCRRCKAKRTKEEEGQDFIVYEAPESHKIVDLYWICDSHQVQREMYG